AAVGRSLPPSAARRPVEITAGAAPGGLDTGAGSIILNQMVYYHNEALNRAVGGLADPARQSVRLDKQQRNPSLRSPQAWWGRGPASSSTSTGWCTPAWSRDARAHDARARDGSCTGSPEKPARFSPNPQRRPAMPATAAPSRSPQDTKPQPRTPHGHFHW